LTGTFPYIFTYTKTNTSGCTASRTHTIHRNPSITNLSEPSNVYLNCDSTRGTFNMTYSDLANITTGITRAGVFISGPTTGALAYSSSSASAGVRTDIWTATNMTLAGTYIYRIEYRNACGSIYKDVSITTSITPGTLNAGSDIVLPCNTLTANPIGTTTAPGSYVWTIVSGPNTPTHANKTSLSTNLSGLIQGVYRMRLNLSNGKKCATKTDEMMVYVTTTAPTTATAGPNATICAGRYQLSANYPNAGDIGTWTASPSSGISFLPHANSPTAYVSGLAPSTSYSFTWTISNGCGVMANSQTLVTTGEQGPPFAAAGSDVCLAQGTTSTALTGSAPGTATILWTALTAGSSVASSNSQNTTANFTGGSGTYLFEYALSSAGCGTLTDTVRYTINTSPITVNAGVDQDICSATWPASTTLTATPSAPNGTTALWSQISGPTTATIATPSDASTTVSNLQTGIYAFEHRISNGACTENADTVLVTVTQQPSAAAAGPDQAICNATVSTNVTLAATAAAVGTGYWQVLTGPAGSATPTITNQTLYNTTIRTLSQGEYTLRWTVTNGPGCPDNTDEMVISVTAAAAAGSATTRCNINSLDLTGNANTTGTWSLVSGPSGSTITTNSGNTAVVTGLIATAPSSVYTFRYTLPVVGSCLASTSDIVLTNMPAPSQADAGADVNVCFNATTATLSGVIPTSGTGTWSRVSGPNTPTAGAANANSYDSSLTNIIAGIYLYTYTVNTNVNCVASTDQIQIAKEVPASAGTDQRVCNATTVSLEANTPTLYQGTWSTVSGPNTPTFADANNPLTAVNSLIPGTYVFRWTIAGPGGCATNSDDVQVIIDASLAGIDAGPDQTFCVGSTGAIAIGTAPIGGVTYSWSPALYLSNSTIAQPNFTAVSSSGTFTYTLTATNGTCQGFDAVTINMV
ncbi:MAG: PKD domain-containing protein, partial [Ferruginibacter sp.]